MIECTFLFVTLNLFGQAVKSIFFYLFFLGRMEEGSSDLFIIHITFFFSHI